MSDSPTSINILNLKKCLASAMTLKRRLKKIHFDERFGLGSIFPSSEETDLIIEVLTKKDLRIVYFPKIILYHPDNEFLSSNTDKIKSKYFHSCDGHWSNYGNEFAASSFLKIYSED